MVSSVWVESQVGANRKSRQRVVLGLAFVLLASLLALVALGVAAPAEGLDDDNVKFAVIGDYGSGNSDEAAVANLIDAHGVDLIVTTGDNSYGSGPIDSNIGAFYADYIGNYQGTNGLGATTNAFFPSVGNHDTGDGGGITAYEDYFSLPGAGIPSSGTSGTERYYDFVRGPVHFFAVDSMGDRSEDGTQGAWLEAQLGLSSSQWNVVYFHHPAYTSTSTHAPTTEMRWRFEEWGADAVFQGHNHIYERNLRDDNGDGIDMPYFVSGLGGQSTYSLGLPLDETELQYNASHGSMVVTASQNSILFEFYSVDGGGTGTLRDDYQILAPVPEDDVKPVITMLGSSSVAVPYGVTYTDAGATAVDDVDGDITAEIVTVGDVSDTTAPGIYSVTYDVKDAAGNAASQVTRTVNVMSGSSPGGGFDDIDGSIFEDDIEWLAAEGITKGCNPPGNTLFCPDDAVSRGEMAAFLHRALGDVLDVDLSDASAFIDDNDSVFEGDIGWLSAAGITRGCNPPTNDRFCPDSKVTREQMAAFLVRALGYTDDGGGDLFVDDDDSIFRRDIDRLATAGVTKGCNPSEGNTKFCPREFVTRAQMAAFLHRALG